AVELEGSVLEQQTSDDNDDSDSNSGSSESSDVELSVQEAAESSVEEGDDADAVDSFEDEDEDSDEDGDGDEDEDSDDVDDMDVDSEEEAQAQPAINASKAQYQFAMEELERFAPIGQELKTRLLEATIAYHSELLSCVSTASDSSSSDVPTSLKSARNDVDAILETMKQQQGYQVADNVVKFIQSTVQDMSDRYRYILLALEMFVAASVWGVESTARTLEEQTQFDEDLRALLDPRRSQAIARLLGIYLIGEEINLTKKASARATDRDRVNRIARTAAEIFRAAVPRRLQPIAAGQAQIHSQVTAQVA
ncbi:hypothetical protein BGZ70_001090, partial [Mortierella alpina]